MLKINNIFVSLTEEKKEIIHGINLEFKKGEIHLLNGNNGSGKSTLVNALMGNPAFGITGGEVILENETVTQEILDQVDPESIRNESIIINELEPSIRSLLGLFLANQYPTEIPGVSLMNYLRLIYNARRSKQDQIPVFKFKKLVEEKAAIINYPKHLLRRNLNEGFSGGEKKKTEILQMLILGPKYVMLDEIDSGLDRNSVKEVFQGLADFKKSSPDTCLIIITHYDRVQEYLKPDFVHEIRDGLLLNN